MRKKKIIVAVLIIAMLVIAAVLGWKLHDSKQEPEEERYVTNVRAMYGTVDYLGPMEEEVKPLTEEQIKKLNPDNLPYVEYDERIDRTNIYGRFNTAKIENVYDARIAVGRALQYVGFAYGEETLMYGSASISNQGVYTYDYFYKGVQCAGIHAGMWVDEAGNSERIWIDCELEKRVALESVVPVYKEEKLQTLLDERYGKCRIRKKTLWICKYGEEYGLEWRIEIDAEKSPVRVLWMNANTGEIWGEDSMTDVY